MSELENEPGVEQEEHVQGDEQTDENEQADEEAVEAEPEPQPDEQTEQQTAGPNPEDMERVSKAMDRATRSYVEKIRANLGDDLSGWVACPCCYAGWPGIVLPRVPESDVVRRIKEWIGEPIQPDYQPDPYSQRCAACNGYGAVSTGSHVGNRGTVQCLDCKGLGYIGTDSRREGGSVLSGNGASGVPVYGQEAPPSDVPPEVEQLRALGYIVVDPVRTDA